MNICHRNKNTLQKTRYTFDGNMFEKCGSMGFKSSDLYIFYRDETHSDNTSLYLIYLFIQKDNKIKSFISTLSKFNGIQYYNNNEIVQININRREFILLYNDTCRRPSDKTSLLHTLYVCRYEAPSKARRCMKNKMNNYSAI